MSLERDAQLGGSGLWRIRATVRGDGKAAKDVTFYATTDTPANLPDVERAYRALTGVNRDDPRGEVLIISAVEQVTDFEADREQVLNVYDQTSGGILAKSEWRL